jgi:hypothetical protein
MQIGAVTDAFKMYYSRAENPAVCRLLVALRASKLLPSALNTMQKTTSFEGFDPSKITRPARRLLRYYAIVALLSNVAFLAVFLPLYFRFSKGRSSQTRIPG